MDLNQPHGQSRVYWIGNVLIIRPSGAFNIEGIQQVALRVKQCIENRPKGEWVRMYVFEDQDTLGPPDSLSFVIESIRRSINLGCIMLISVGGSVINRESLEMVCDEAGMPLAFCDTFDEGLLKADEVLGNQTVKV